VPSEFWVTLLTFSETVEGIPNDKENAILCQTLVFYQYKDGLFAT
jgi:hypothetical protein